MIAFNDSGTTTKESIMKESEEKCLDSQLWHACAGNMVHIPHINSKIYYFPQGHAEHAYGNVDFGGGGVNFPRIPALTLCRVGDVKFKADPDTDEVYVKMRLFPLRIMNESSIHYDDEGGGGGGGGVLCNNNNNNRSEGGLEKASSFSKTLTQSDANNGGGFSVPRYCAETIFPRLDYSAEPPVQTVLAKDVHGEVWKFRHIYRGTPRRHLLTTGWSSFVNQKKLIAGDSIVFLRTESGDLCVGIRRLKKDGGGGGGGGGGGPESAPSGWNPNPNPTPTPNPTPGGNCVSQYGGFSVFLREDENHNKLLMRNVNGAGAGGGGNSNTSEVGSGSLKGRQRVRPESVIEAANLAANGQPFEIVYYPRASTPEFFVKASTVRAAMRIQWCHGMRFKMAFETEDSSRISWFMGTISSVQVADPVRWPNSPWRLLQVSWDEPELLQNVKRISPWLVELVSNMPAIHLSPFSPPRKKMRLPQHPDFILDGQLALPPFSSNSLGPSMCYLTDNTPVGIQGARHVQFGTPLPDLHLNKLHSGLFPTCFQRFDPGPAPSRISNNISMSNSNTYEDVSCTLTIGNSSPSLKKADEGKTLQFVLFGKPIIVAQQQISVNCSGDTVSPVHTGNTSSDVNLEKTVNLSDGSASALYRHGRQENSSCDGFPWSIDRQTTDLGLETGHCKVFLEKEDVGRTLDLSVLGSYEELYRKLATMFGIERSEMMNHVRYQDATGALRQTGDEPFSEFMKTARRLTVLMDSGGDSREKRKWITGLRSAEIGINTSTTTNKAGALSIFA